MNKRELGVIDSVSAGLNTVARAWWVILIPVALDLLYWLGPKLSIAPLVRSLLAAFPSAAEIGADAENLAVLRDSLEQVGETLNLLSLLSVQLLGMPSLLIAENPGDVSISRLAPVLEVSNLSAFIPLSFGLTLLGLLLGCLYLALIARRLQGEESALSIRLWRQVPVYWGRVVVLTLLVVAAAIIVNVPVMLAGMVLGLISQFLAVLVAAMWSISVFWVLIFLFFTVDAIVINDVGPLRAAWNSFNVVRFNFWPALGLILLINILTAGLSIIWRRLTVNDVGALIGIVGNAFIGTSLVAAGLIFYRDRYLKWQEVQHGRDDGRATDG